jgi:hypothetical protein
MEIELVNNLKYIKNLPEYIIESISWYTGGNFDKLNEKLRKNKELNETEYKNLKNIDIAFESVFETVSPFIVYKGKTSKNVYSDKAFISTSINIEEAKKFAGENCCVLKIIVSPGSKILYIKDISRYKNENEILLDKNGILLATSSYIDNGMIIINCTYVNGSSKVLHDNKDISTSIKSLKNKQDETSIFNILMEMFDESEYEFLDIKYISDIYSKFYTIDDFTINVFKKFIDLKKN